MHTILKKEIVNDYFTANVKAEVIFDTILTPVIGEILTEICFSETDEKMRLITKEFPLLKGNKSYRSHNVDYLMHDNKFVYLVELKTTQGSINKPQMETYLFKIYEGEKFGAKLGSDFIQLLYRVSRTGRLEWAENVQEEDLKKLFEIIIKYPYKDISIDSNWKQQKKHASRAIVYLKENKVYSSKKYLLTAGNLLDHMDEVNWWNHEVKLLYLVPGKKPEDDMGQDGIIWVSFQDIIQKSEQIKGRIEETKMKEYWGWVVSILEQCF